MEMEQFLGEAVASFRIVEAETGETVATCMANATDRDDLNAAWRVNDIFNLAQAKRPDARLSVEVLNTGSRGDNDRWLP